MEGTTDIEKKLIDFDRFCKIVKPGSKIFITSGPAKPLQLIQHIVKTKHRNFQDIEFIQVSTFGDVHKEFDQGEAKIRFKTFNIGESIGKGSNRQLDYISASLEDIPLIFKLNSLDIDIAIIQTSPPDEFGMLNLGIVSDVAHVVVEHTPIVIAEINPNVPITFGETQIHIDQVDYLIESNLNLMEYQKQPFDGTLYKVGRNVANLIDDDSVLALCPGKLNDALTVNLHGKKRLKVCSYIISDWIMELIEAGIVSFEKELRIQGVVTASACFGSKKLYDYVNRNPYFNFAPLVNASYQTLLPQIKNFTSVMNVMKIDASGDSIMLEDNEEETSSFQMKLNMALAAARSRGGKSIIAIRSQDEKKQSNIVIQYKKNKEQIRSVLGTTRYVVTEYGIANIFSKTLNERTMALIDIAHPDHRDKLLAEAKEAGFIHQDQIYIKDHAINYPHDLETVKLFKNHLEVKFRAIKPSDEDMMRRFFYRLADDSKYMRYFHAIRAMPHERMQTYVNIDYDDTMSIVGTLTNKGVERIIAEARYSGTRDVGKYEMAFVVDEEFQGHGIASFLLDHLIAIAEDRKIPELTATTLKQNAIMIRIFSNARIKPRIIEDEDIRFSYQVKANKMLEEMKI